MTSAVNGPTWTTRLCLLLAMHIIPTFAYLALIIIGYLSILACSRLTLQAPNTVVLVLALIGTILSTLLILSLLIHVIWRLARPFFRRQHS